jgi:MFS family permease
MALDRFEPRRILLAGLISQGASLLLAGVATDMLTLWLYGASQGLAAGILATVVSSVWSHYYGRRHVGGIKGVAQMLFVVGTALGPLPFAICRDWFGSYRLAFLASFVALLILFSITLVVQPHRRRSLSAAETRV